MPVEEQGSKKIDLLNKRQINQLYNQDIKIEDSEKTSFYYHKTLAYEFLIVVFTLITICTSLLTYFTKDTYFLTTQSYSIILVYTLLTMCAVVLEKLSIIAWIKEKRDFEMNPKHQYITMVVEILLLIPIPNEMLGETVSFQIKNISGEDVTFFVNDVLTAYLLLRSIYLVKFLIHAELYYGSRPDRLSRLYTVKFGTFNAVKFLINEKPLTVLLVIFIITFVFLPLLLMLVESKVNSNLDNFVACLYFEIISQTTVGYGDILASTFIGRFISAISILVGITSTSMVLIFFKKFMHQDPREEESHSLLSILEIKKEVTKSRVQRLEQEWSYLKTKTTPEHKEDMLETLRQFRFQNGRNIRYQCEQPTNIKRMMLRNFSQLTESLALLKETDDILAKYILIIHNSKTHANTDSNQENQILLGM